MSMTQQDTEWHKLYARYRENPSSPRETEIADAVDEAWSAVRLTLNSADIRTSNSDPAECLVAAIMRYVVESQNDHA